MVNGKADGKGPAPRDGKGGRLREADYKGLLKKAGNRLLTRAAQKRCHVFAGCYRAATVMERVREEFFSSLCKSAAECNSAPRS